MMDDAFGGEEVIEFGEFGEIALEDRFAQPGF